jgi:hypothetical protein
VCALALLGRSPHQLPPIVFLDSPPPGVSANAEAFVLRNPATIYLITSTESFSAALGDRDICRGGEELRRIASIIVHEEWHVRYGPDEKGAYEAQLSALQRMGVEPGRPLYASVTRSMLAVLDARRRAAAGRAVLASAR